MSEDKTAAELLEELQRDAEYKARMAEKHQSIKSKRIMRKDEQFELLNSLAESGVSVGLVEELRERPEDLKKAIPVLLKSLDTASGDVVNSILFALSTPAGISAWSGLKQFLDRAAMERNARLVLSITTAMANLASDEVVGDVIQLASDESLGEGRLPLLLALQKSSSPSAKMCLLSLKNDPSLRRSIRKMTRLAKGH